jgi:hypothetical protein
MDWRQQAVENAKRRLATAAESAKVEVPVNMKTPTLRQLFSCVPDAAHPWDPNVMKEIWKIDKSFRPLWIKYIYTLPDKTERVVGRHGVARYVDPVELKSYAVKLHFLEHVEMPTMPCQGLTFNAPNYAVTQWFLNDGTKEGPHEGSYLPFTMEFYHWLRENYIDPTDAVKKYDAYAATVKEKAMQDGLEREERFRKYANKVIDATPESDQKLAFAHLLNNTTKAAKPYVFLGR